jgi:pyruvate dehydrogenase (quinone)
VPYESFHAKPGQARCVQADLDPSRISLRYPVDAGLAGDAATVPRALIPRLLRNEDRSFHQRSQEGMPDWRQLLHERAASADTRTKPVVPHVQDTLLADGRIMVADSGTGPTWLARHWKIRDEQMFSVSGNLATMSYGLPYAVGAPVAYPHRQVVAYVGDGASRC